jgi:transcriptional regulator with XRE-family HTH domain
MDEAWAERWLRAAVRAGHRRPPEVIRAARLLSGAGWSEFARRLGVSLPTVESWAAGQIPTGHPRTLLGRLLTEEVGADRARELLLLVPKRDSGFVCPLCDRRHESLAVAEQLHGKGLVDDAAREARIAARIADRQEKLRRQIQKREERVQVSLKQAEERRRQQDQARSQLRRRYREIAQLYAAGLTLTEVGREFGISHQRVSQILQSLNVPARRGGRPPSGKSDGEPEPLTP